MDFRPVSQIALWEFKELSSINACRVCGLPVEAVHKERERTFMTVVVVCTDLYGKEPHRQVGRVSDIMEPRWCNG